VQKKSINCPQVIVVKVRVWLKFETYVPYVVEVDGPELEKVREALLKKDADEWEFDPNFYEKLGTKYREMVSRVTEDDLEILEE